MKVKFNLALVQVEDKTHDGNMLGYLMKNV